jgi:hypothetical protein
MDVRLRPEKQHISRSVRGFTQEKEVNEILDLPLFIRWESPEFLFEGRHPITTGYILRQPNKPCRSW